MKINTDKNKPKTGAKAISSLLDDKNKDTLSLNKKKPTRERIQESVYFYDQDIEKLKKLQSKLEQTGHRGRTKKITKAKIAQAIVLYMLDSKKEEELYQITKNYI